MPFLLIAVRYIRYLMTGHIVSCDSIVIAAVVFVYRIFKNIRIIRLWDYLMFEALVDRLLVLLNYGQAVHDLGACWQGRDSLLAGDLAHLWTIIEELLLIVDLDSVLRDL